MIEKMFGKIEGATFGYCGYQDAWIGFSATLRGEGWGTGVSRGFWDSNIIKDAPTQPGAKWTEDTRTCYYGDVVRYVSDLLHDAKVSSVDKLNGIPIEAIFENNILKSWRVLKEVL